MIGLILVDKPEGITSFSAVNAIKRKAQEKRVGHTGTLDPMATGVLPILLGRATALSSLLLEGDKRYIAEIKLGVTTDTDDITGNVISKAEVDITQDKVETALKDFLGCSEQIPPMYSAIKKDGVRLYKLAREGKTAEIPSRKITVYEVNIISKLNSENIIKVEFFVSKGTYIRSLARDLGEKLGCGATLYSLRRTATCGFNIDSCVCLDDLCEENIKDYILSEELAVSHLREIFVTEKQAVRFSNGGQLSFDRLGISTEDFKENELFRVKYKNIFLGVGFADTEKREIGIKCVIRSEF
ncbi:MAG: tRNA pseudouridine(55) synthase TruB [Clostridia bacterium]|nr:tRNA pseudouridine(55) synthase TruB [Clostridia bacterium]